MIKNSNQLINNVHYVDDMMLTRTMIQMLTSES
jgi:hypothetical protein